MPALDNSDSLVNSDNLLGSAVLLEGNMPSVGNGAPDLEQLGLQVEAFKSQYSLTHCAEAGYSQLVTVISQAYDHITSISVGDAASQGLQFASDSAEKTEALITMLQTGLTAIEDECSLQLETMPPALSSILNYAAYAAKLPYLRDTTHQTLGAAEVTVKSIKECSDYLNTLLLNLRLQSAVTELLALPSNNPTDNDQSFLPQQCLVLIPPAGSVTVNGVLTTIESVSTSLMRVIDNLQDQPTLPQCLNDLIKLLDEQLDLAEQVEGVHEMAESTAECCRYLRAIIEKIKSSGFTKREAIPLSDQFEPEPEPEPEAALEPGAAVVAVGSLNEQPRSSEPVVAVDTLNGQPRSSEPVVAVGTLNGQPRSSEPAPEAALEPGAAVVAVGSLNGQPRSSEPAPEVALNTGAPTNTNTHAVQSLSLGNVLSAVAQGILGASILMLITGTIMSCGFGLTATAIYSSLVSALTGPLHLFGLGEAISSVLIIFGGVIGLGLVTILSMYCGQAMCWGVSSCLNTCTSLTESSGLHISDQAFLTRSNELPAPDQASLTGSNGPPDPDQASALIHLKQ